MPIKPEDQKQLTVAEGYIELGMIEDAEAELEHLAPEISGHPEVLLLRLRIFQASNRWAAMQSAARKLAELDPANPQWVISWAYATRRAESIELARLILVDALDRHPLEALIHYNLACYDCVLQNLESAKEFLARALRLEPRMKEMALEDQDLEPLWPSLSRQ